MPHPTDFSALVVPAGHTFVDDVGGSGGTPLDAAHLNPLRDDALGELYDHIQNLSGVNNHPTANIFETGAGAENTTYANVAGADYSQAAINAMFRLLLRYILGGTTNVATLTSMVATLLGRTDAASVNLLSLADLIATATPNDTLATVVKRGATNGEVNLRGLVIATPVGSTLPGGLTWNRVAGQVLPFFVARDETATITLAQLTAAGLMQGTQGLFAATDPTLAALLVRAAATPTADVAVVADSTGATKWWRVTKDGHIVGLGGFYTGATGSEKQVIDASGNFIATLLTPRQHGEFVVVPSATALTATNSGGKYVDSLGAGQTVAPGTLTVTSDATKHVWWALSYGNAGAQHFTANTAGANSVAGSATKANFPATDYPVGYLRVPPGVTTLAAAVYEDWRGAKAGDGNDGAGGGMAITTSAITDLDESVAYANSKQLAAVASGQKTVAGPPGNTAAAALAAHLRSGDRGGGDFDAALADRLFNDASPGFAQSIAVGAGIMTVVASTNSPQWLGVSGRWRRVTANTATPTATSGAAGIRYLIADLSGAGPGFALFLSTSNAVAAFQKVVADCWWDGAFFQGLLNTSYIQKLIAAQYTPVRYSAATNPTANGANITTPITGGPTLDISVTAASLAQLSFTLSHNGSAVGRTQYQIIQRVNGGAYALVYPYGEVEYLVAGQVNRGSVTGAPTLLLTPGRNEFAIGGAAVTGTAVTPNAAYLFATVFGN